MILHGGLGDIERAADRLVALAPHHQREHIHLPQGQPEFGG
jgi:hypothetical protein